MDFSGGPTKTRVRSSSEERGPKSGMIRRKLELVINNCMVCPYMKIKYVCDNDPYHFCTRSDSNEEIINFGTTPDWCVLPEA
jgi:hypothetical protein